MNPQGHNSWLPAPSSLQALQPKTCPVVCLKVVHDARHEKHMFPVKWDSCALFQHLGGDRDGRHFCDLCLCEETEEETGFQIPRPPWTFAAFSVLQKIRVAVNMAVLASHLTMG